MSTPDLTVIVPVYNGMPYLVETVDSILAQDYPNFELLLMNDGSTDDGESQKYLDSLTDPRVRVIHKQNEGLCATLNRAFGEAHGRYVARIDQDDVCMPNRFKVQYDYLTAHPEVDCVFSMTQKIGGKKSWDNTDKIPSVLADGQPAVYDPLRDGCLLHSTMMGKRDIFLDVGGYRQDYYPADDFDLAFRLAESYTLHMLPEALVKYRFHAGANTYKFFDRMQVTTRWAKHSALRRRNGQNELTREAFAKESQEARLKTINRKRKDAAKFYIRQAGHYYLDGKYLHMLYPLVMGTVFDPLNIFNRFKRVTRKLLRSGT